MEKINPVETNTISLVDIANELQKILDLNNSNIEDKNGTPLGFQYPDNLIQKFDEARFLCLLTDVYLKHIDEWMEGNISIQGFIEKLDASKAALK